MFYYKAIIQYNGSKYCGFQFVPEIPTIQNELNLALKQLNLGKVTTNCASRTDTGVHAFSQIIKITSEKEIKSNFIENINQYLPLDIYTKEIEPCSWDFHPSKNSKQKTYRYLFINKKTNLDNGQLISNIANNLNFGNINNAISLINGEHDFINFCSAGSNVKTTIRTITHVKLSTINPHQEFNSHLFNFPGAIDECYQVEITGNGFLKQMVRHIISALWSVGTGKITINEFEELLNSPKKAKQLWKVAPPDGLYLYDIKLK